MGLHAQVIWPDRQHHLLTQTAAACPPGQGLGRVAGTADRHCHPFALLGQGSTRQAVAKSHEIGHRQVNRQIMQFGRTADLLHLAIAHHHDAVSQGQRLFLVMGDVDRGRALLKVNAPNFLAHLQSQLGVQVGQGLIHQHQ